MLCTSQGPGRVSCDVDSRRIAFNLKFKSLFVALHKKISVFPVTQSGKTRVILVY